MFLTSMRRPLDRFRERLESLQRADRDSGVVAVVTAVLMLVLLGFLGFAVDAGHWYLVKQQTQKAADAAALAGVVDLPDNLVGARGLAAQYAGFNGFPEGAGPAGTTAVVATQAVDDPNRLDVSVTTTVTNFFTQLFGVPTTVISSTGGAVYNGPVRIGSPCNRLGTDPERAVTSAACAKASGRLFVNINAPGTLKVNGDPFSVLPCSTIGRFSRCDPAATPNNLDYTPDGYFYNITVKRAMTLTLQLFDAPWVDVGAQCDGIPVELASLSGVADAATRYAHGVSSPYCTGDSKVGGHDADPVEDTTFTLRSPSGGTDLASHPVVGGVGGACDKTYDGYEPASAAEFAGKLTPGSPTYDTALAPAFRKWSSLCTIDAVPGNYLLQVTSSGDIGAGNRFSIRAVGASDGDNANVSVSGHESMGLYANDTNDAALFYLARLPSSAAGQTLKVSFFDIGDCANTCHMQILTTDVGAPRGCVGEGPKAGALAGCGFDVGPAFNGQWETVRVPIPSTYTCVDRDLTACWYGIQFNGEPTDVTAWTAEMDQQSLRLVP